MNQSKLSPAEQELFNKIIDDKISIEEQVEALEKYIADCFIEEMKVITFEDFTQSSIGGETVSRWEYQMTNGKYILGHTAVITNKRGELLWKADFEPRQGADERFEEWDIVTPTLQETLNAINEHHQRGKLE